MARGWVLCREEREEISRGIVAEESGHEIGRWIGRHFSVVNREIARHGGRAAYRATEAQQNAIVSARRPKDPTVDRDPLLLTEVNKGVTLTWSPQQISARLAEDFPTMRRCECPTNRCTVLYQASFVHAKGQLKVQLVRAAADRASSAASAGPNGVRSQRTRTPSPT